MAHALVVMVGPLARLVGETVEVCVDEVVVGEEGEWGFAEVVAPSLADVFFCEGLVGDVPSVLAVEVPVAQVVEFFHDVWRGEAEEWRRVGVGGQTHSVEEV